MGSSAEEGEVISKSGVCRNTRNVISNGIVERGFMLGSNTNGIVDHEGTLKTAKDMPGEGFFASFCDPDFHVCFYQLPREAQGRGQVGHECGVSSGG